MARRAGVSQSTVSLVLSGKSAGRISARTEAAVRQAADELGYRPNVAARALRTGTARTVGLVVTDVTHPFFGPVLRGAQVAAWRAGYAVALVDVANDPDRELASFEALRAGPVDGFLFFTVDPPESIRRARRRARGLAARACRSCASTPSAGPSSRCATCSSSATRGSATWRSELDAETFRLRRDTLLRDARRGGAGARPLRAAPFRFDEAEGPALELLDAPSGRRRSTATTTCWPAASTSPRASAGCGSPATSRSSASTTSRSRRSSSRR